MKIYLFVRCQRMALVKALNLIAIQCSGVLEHKPRMHNKFFSSVSFLLGTLDVQQNIK